MQYQRQSQVLVIAKIKAENLLERQAANLFLRFKTGTYLLGTS